MDRKLAIKIIMNATPSHLANEESGNNPDLTRAIEYLGEDSQEYIDLPTSFSFDLDKFPNEDYSKYYNRCVDLCGDFLRKLKDKYKH